MSEEAERDAGTKQHWTLGHLLITITFGMPPVAVVQEVKAAGGGVLRYLIGLPLALVLGCLVVLVEWYSGRFFWRQGQKCRDTVQQIVAFGLLGLQAMWILLAGFLGSWLADLIIAHAPR